MSYFVRLFNRLYPKVPNLSLGSLDEASKPWKSPSPPHCTWRMLSQATQSSSARVQLSPARSVGYLASQPCSLFAVQELEELLTEIKDISVVLGIDNACKLDLSRIVEEVRAQYEALALRSWEEAEALTRRKVSGSLSDGY